MDSDRPPERWSWLDAVGWLCGLWPALKDRLHRWLHRDLPECPDCAANLKKADEWARRFLALERDLAREQAKREVAPGTSITDAEFAVASDTLLTGQPSRFPAREPNLEEVIANMAGPPKQWPPGSSYPPHKPSGSAVIPLLLGGTSITTRAAARRGTKHPAHSRPQEAWPQRRSCVPREATP